MQDSKDTAICGIIFFIDILNPERHAQDVRILSKFWSLVLPDLQQNQMHKKQKKSMDNKVHKKKQTKKTFFTFDFLSPCRSRLAE